MDKSREKLLGKDKNLNIEGYIEFLHMMSENTDDYLFLWEFENNRIWFAGMVDEFYELKDSKLTCCTIEDVFNVIYHNDRATVIAELQQLRDGKSDTHNMEYRWVNKDGKAIWISCRGKAITDDNGCPFAMLGRVSDTALKHKVDAKTGRFNKIKMMEDMQDILVSDAPGFLMLVGVDGFKNINIRFGRIHGDDILRLVAKALEAAVGSGLQIYRLDGDCFAVNLPVASREEVNEIYKKVQDSLAEECTVSAGVVSYGELPIKDTDLLYQYAEDALDKAKKKGKNTIVFFETEDFDKKVSEIELLEEIKESVKNGCEGFYLVYQPQVETKTYRVYGAEALLRYKSPTKGMVFPNQFIPLLEETGLICPVGLWVIETALNDCKKWREKNPNFHISINISYVQLKQENIAAKVLDILEKSGLPGEGITLEVTESMQLQEYKYFNDIFYIWKKAGIEMSVDDFGTGYSSLAYLKELEIDEIKIDRCFVSGIQFSSYNYRLIRNMLELARGSQIRVCCEGVELEEEMKVLRGLNANLMQGYLFAKPCEKEQFEELYVGNTVPEYCERLHTNELWNRREKANVEAEQGNQLRDFSNFHYEDVLNATDVGLWVIRIDEKTGINEMYADETMRRIMAVDGNLTAEECYMHWYTRVKDICFDYVNTNVSRMIEAGVVVQLQYIWNHPLLGEVVVRCSGIRVEDSDGKICLEGYHRIINDMEETKFSSEVSPSVI